MLPKKYRLAKDKEFKKVFRRSKKIETENLSFRVAKRDQKTKELKNLRTNNKSTNQQINKSTSATRFGFIVSNKIDKRASRRNGVKRRLRAAVGEMLDDIKTGYDVVIIVKKPFVYPPDYIKIKEQVKKGLGKLF